MKEPVGAGYGKFYGAGAGQDMQEEDSQDFDDGESNVIESNDQQVPQKEI